MKYVIKNETAYWITNISNRNVSLADLNLTVKAWSSVNLLDGKHYYYTLEQLNESVKNGSLFNKRDKIFVRKVPPQIIAAINVPIINEAYIPSRERSTYSIKEEKYEELEMSDEDFIKNNI